MLGLYDNILLENIEDEDETVEEDITMQSRLPTMPDRDAIDVTAIRRAKKSSKLRGLAAHNDQRSSTSFINSMAFTQLSTVKNRVFSPKPSDLSKK